MDKLIAFLANWGEAIYQYRQEYLNNMLHLEELPTEKTSTEETSTVVSSKPAKEMKKLESLESTN
ncbi:MAG: hypothetical protein PHU23_08485 [Dehalococcoidales bacterium]|nr:hypothetical protein [Dehalococcoidales bacterium]